MSNTFLPFNFAPKNQTILATGGTTTYTIPANEFGLVTINANRTSTQGSVTLNGTTFFKSSYVVSASQTSGANAGQTYSAPSGGQTVTSIFSSATPSDQPLRNFNSAQSATVSQTALGAGITSTITHTTVYAVGPDSMTNVWVKAGDVVAISGGDLTVVIHRYDLPA